MKSSTPTQVSLVSPMDWQIERLPGLRTEDCNKLKNCSSTTTLELLHRASSTTKREALAIQLAVPLQNINKWVIMADLARIPAVGCKYCGLLLHIGICSTAQLARTSLYDLQKQVMRFQVQILHRADLCPSVGQMASWIQQAQQLTAENRLRKSANTEG